MLWSYLQLVWLHESLSHTFHDYLEEKPRQLQEQITQFYTIKWAKANDLLLALLAWTVFIEK